MPVCLHDRRKKKEMGFRRISNKLLGFSSKPGLITA
jgi:hypothetical protein